MPPRCSRRILLLTALLWFAPAPAFGAARFHFAAPARIDQQRPYSHHTALRGAACPSRGVCVTTATGGRLVWVTGVGTGHEHSRSFTIDPQAASGFLASLQSVELTAVTCPGTRRCLAVDSGGAVVTFTLSARGRASWHRTVIEGHALNAIACPAANLCVAGDNTGGLLTTHHPSGPAGGWHRELVDHSPVAGFVPDVTAVTCASLALCVALDEFGSVLTSRDVTAARPIWHYAQLPYAEGAVGSGGPANGVACPSVRMCVLVSANEVTTTTDPSGGSQAWHTTAVEPRPRALTAVSCPTVASCIAVDSNGDALRSTAPAGGATAWSVQRISRLGPSDGDSDADLLTGLACAPVRCLTVGRSGGAFTTAAPAANWTARTLTLGYDSLQGVVCPSAAECLAYDDAGNVLHSVRGGAPGSWHGAAVDPGHAIVQLTCPTAGLCIGLDDAHRVLTSTAPAGGAGAWRVANVDPGGTLNSIACPSSGLCVGVDNSGNAVTTTAPGTGGWTVTDIDDVPPAGQCGAYYDIDPEHAPNCNPSLTDVTCASPAFCGAIDENQQLVAATAPAGDPANWRQVDVFIGAGADDDGSSELTELACPSASLCLAVTDGHALLASSTPAMSTSWHAIDGTGMDQIYTISCATAAVCAGRSDDGVALISRPGSANPRVRRIASEADVGACPAASACFAQADDGRLLATADPTAADPTVTASRPDTAALAPQLACPSAHRCLAVDGAGDLIVAAR